MSLIDNVEHLVNIDLENDLLGGILLKPEDIKKMYLKQEVFYHKPNQHIYYLMKRLEEQGFDPEHSVIMLECSKTGEYDQGEIYNQIKQIVANHMVTSNNDYKQNQLQELYMKRAQVELAYKIIKTSKDDRFSYEQINSSIKKQINIIDQSMPNKRDNHISAYLKEAMNDMETNKGGLEGSPTHFKELDYMVGGMKRGELIIIGANPSVGKTVMATNIAQQHGLHNDGVTAIFSLEMSGKALSQRMISSMSNIPTFKIKNAYNKFVDKDWVSTLQTIGIMGESNTEIIEDTSLTISDIRRMSYAIKDKYDKDKHMVILIDYLGLIRKEDSRQQTREHMKDIAIGLKNLSKELDCTVIALSQLSRDNEKDKRKPIMADLKESGDLEAA